MSERMFGLLRDLSTAAKVATRAPGHSLLVVLILTLGIGATVTVFTLVDQTLLRPAPFRDGDRLVDVLDVRRGGGGGSILTPEKILGWQQEASVFEGFEVYSPSTFDCRQALKLTACRGSSFRRVSSTCSGYFLWLGT